MSKKPTLVIIILVLLNLILGACAENSTALSPTTAPTAFNKPVVVPNITASTTLPYDCTKIFCFGLAQEPSGFLQANPVFDPANLIDRPSLQISRQIYETLFEFKPADMQYQYSIIIKYEPTISADGLTYTIRLGKGLRFSDNTPLDAAAVAFNFERWSHPANFYHKGEFETWHKYFDGFPGNLESVIADQERNIVTIKLRHPMGSLFQILAMPQFAMVAPSAFDAKTGELVRSIGSGWYQLDKVVRTELKYAVLSENKFYHTERYNLQDPNTPFVKSPTVVALVLKQNQDGLEELRKGTIAATDKIRPEQLQTASDLRLLERRPLSLSFLAMSHTQPPFNNILVRQALAYGIDTRKLVQDYYYSLGQVATVFLPPTALAHIDFHQPYPYDPERARRLLEVAGYGQANPLILDLWVLPVPRSYYPDPRKIADQLAADLLQIGLQITVRDSKSWPEFRKDRLNGDMSLYMFGWQGENGDPDEFLGEFFGQARGEGGYENPILQQLIASGLAQSDLKDRRNFYKEAQDIIYEQLPVIPLAYVKGVIAIRSDLQGYIANPSGIESWATVWVGK